MVSQSWLIILSVSFFILTMSFLVGIFFLVFASMEIRKASTALKDFLKVTEERLKPGVEEAEQTLKHIGKVAADVGTITEDVKNLSSAITEMVVNIRAMSSLLGTLQEGLSVRLLGLKAGVKTALDVLMKKTK